MDLTMIIMKGLAEEFKKQFTCLGKNIEKYITTYLTTHKNTVPTKKEVTKINKNGEEVTKNISYILRFIDIARFMASSLLNLVNNISQGIHRNKCKFGHDNEKCETCGIKYKYRNCFLEYTNFNDDLIEYKGLCCNKSYQRKCEEKLKERFSNIYKSSWHNNNKFILFLRKGVYPFEYKDDWEKLNEDVSDADYAHAIRVCKDFEMKH